MSMSITKIEKTIRSYYHLMAGKTTTVEYLDQVSIKNQDKMARVSGYLEKHQREIINYNRRSRAGKTIGSGRIEKGVDLTVGFGRSHESC